MKNKAKSPKNPLQVGRVFYRNLLLWNTGHFKTFQLFQSESLHSFMRTAPLDRKV
ncbi:hypothetical protein ADICYQ_3413 [Cyclobacterium qasimii M12-11B]|uniref:Uncharacterized protein n=1 Tax=Cyclobacterium qasimii M12-11B TaxID=641524 RepID=S7VBM7_9BACT|nr:hypothetical protein ADICYQ_3413 [Cyclobacterium qasimii M12-11B]